MDKVTELVPLTTAEKLSLQELVSAAKAAGLTPCSVATIGGRVDLCMNLRDRFVKGNLDDLAETSKLANALKAATTVLVVLGDRASNGRLLETMCAHKLVHPSPLEGVFVWS